MKVDRYYRPEDPADADTSRYRTTPTDGSTWEAEIIQAAGQYLWRLVTETLAVDSHQTFASEEYALKAVVRYILDVEAASQACD